MRETPPSNRLSYRYFDEVVRKSCSEVRTHEIAQVSTTEADSAALESSSLWVSRLREKSGRSVVWHARGTSSMELQSFLINRELSNYLLRYSIGPSIPVLSSFLMVYSESASQYRHPSCVRDHFKTLMEISPPYYEGSRCLAKFAVRTHSVVACSYALIHSPQCLGPRSRRPRTQNGAFSVNFGFKRDLSSLPRDQRSFCNSWNELCTS